jgi:hypothetical protein
LLIAGAPDGVGLRTTPRTVDIAPLCARVLGLSTDLDAPGDPHS